MSSDFKRAHAGKVRRQAAKDFARDQVATKKRAGSHSPPKVRGKRAKRPTPVAEFDVIEIKSGPLAGCEANVLEVRADTLLVQLFNVPDNVPTFKDGDKVTIRRQGAKP